MSSELSIDSIFSPEEILLRDEQMLKQRIDKIFAQNHEYRYVQKERKFLLKLILEKDFSLEDIKEHLERVMHNSESKTSERNLLNNQIQIVYTRMVAERKLRAEDKKLRKQEEENQQEKEENNDEK